MIYSWEDFITYNWIELRLIDTEIERSLFAFNQILKSQDELLHEINQKFNKELEYDLEYKSLENNNSYYQAFYETEKLTIEELEKQQRFSFLLSIFSFHELILKKICLKIKQEFSLKIRKKLSTESLFDVYYEFLTDVFKINTSKTETYFTIINNQKETRNKIAHQSGYLFENDKEKIKVINGLTIIEIENEQYLNIDSNYLFYLTENISSFYKELIPAIDERYKTLKLN